MKPRAFILSCLIVCLLSVIIEGHAKQKHSLGKAFRTLSEKRLAVARGVEAETLPRFQATTDDTDDDDDDDSPTPITSESGLSSVPEPNSVKKEQECLAQKIIRLQKQRQILESYIKGMKVGDDLTKGVDYSASVVEPPTPGEEVTAVATPPPRPRMPKPTYTAPVVLLLPGETTPWEKLQFFRAMACRRHMAAERRAELESMSTVKGKTMQEIEEETKVTERELQRNKQERDKIHTELRRQLEELADGGHVKAEVEFLRKDLEDKDKEIEIRLKKLKALEERRAALTLVEKEEETKEEEESEESKEPEEVTKEEQEKETKGPSKIRRLLNRLRRNKNRE